MPLAPRDITHLFHSPVITELTGMCLIDISLFTCVVMKGKHAPAIIVRLLRVALHRLSVFASTTTTVDVSLLNVCCT